MSHASERGSDQFQILNRVVDSLDLRVYRDYTASSWLEGEIDEWRGRIQNAKPGQPDFVSLPGLGSWQLKRAKRGAYELTLIHRQIGDVHIWNPAKWRGKQVSDTGQLYVSFRSVYLQQGGITGALEFIERLCGLLFGKTRLFNPEAVEFTRISRADVAVDYADRRVLTMTKEEAALHSTITWGDLDLYQTRGKRTKREAWLTPFNGSGHDELIKVLRASRKKSHEIRDALKTLGVRPSPGPDNRGGHCDNSTRNGFVGAPSQTEQQLEKTAVLDGESSTAIALEKTVMLLADMLIEGIQTDGKAQLTRVIGGRKPQTVYLGRFGSDLYAREYHKQATLVTQNKGYLLDTRLAAGRNPNTPVWRLEFSLSGDFLRQFVDTTTGERVDLRDPATFGLWIPRVWAYLTRTWMRHSVQPLGNSPFALEFVPMVEAFLEKFGTKLPRLAARWLRARLKPYTERDDNRSRWRPSERWQALQNAWKADHEYMRLKRPPNPDITGLSAGMNGYAKSIIAKLTADPHLRARALERLGLTSEPKDKKARQAYRKALLEECKAELLSRLSGKMYDEEEQAGFDADVLERQALFGFDMDSDTALSSLLRADRMRDGDGS